MYRYCTNMLNRQTNGEEACAASGDNYFLIFLHVTILCFSFSFDWLRFVGVYCFFCIVPVLKWASDTRTNILSSVSHQFLLCSLFICFSSYSLHLSLSPKLIYLSFHPSFLFSQSQVRVTLFPVTGDPGPHLMSSFTTAPYSRHLQG